MKHIHVWRCIRLIDQALVITIKMAHSVSQRTKLSLSEFLYHESKISIARYDSELIGTVA